MCDQQSLRSACPYAQSDQSLWWSLEYSTSVKLLTKHHLEFLRFKGGCNGSSESTRVKIQHGWKSHVKVHLCTSFQVAVCNLASIALNMYVKPDKTYDFLKLAEVTKVIVRNLNKIIEVNYYPVPEVSRTPVGVGVHISEYSGLWKYHARLVRPGPISSRTS